MADEIHGQKMSDYTPLSDLTQAEQETYLANAAVTTYGKTSVGGANTNVNVPLSAIKPDVPVTDVQVGGSSVVSNGVAIIQKYSADYPIMNTGYEFSLDYNHDQFTIAGDNNTELTLTNPVPPPGDNAHRGEFLTVNNSDEIVWDTIPTAPTYTAGTGIDITSNAISVTLPVPDPGTNEHRGHVLTVNNSDDTIEWAAPQGGGGGGGNPYTKVEVTPEAAVLNGKKSSYGFVLFDQSVNIANNTLSVIPGGIGYEDRENPDEESYDIWSKAIDVFKINLPAGTDFPMAVVEFPLTPNQGASVNTIEVYVGSTKLTQIRDVPYRDDAIVGNEIYADAGMEHVTDSGSNYWKWTDIWGNNLASAKTAIVNMNNDGYTNPKVQVHIFGSCYRVMSSVQTEIVPAS